MSGFIRRRVVAVCAALLVGVTAASTTAAEAAPRVTAVSPVTLVKQAKKPPMWRVVIQGYVSGMPFRRVGVIKLAPTVTRVTTNKVNPVEACLVSGTPSVQPEAGAIHFSSNSLCYGYATRLDMGFVQVTGGTLIFAPDPRMAATFVNNHTDRTSILSCIYYPVSGRGTYSFSSNGVVRGTLGFQGYAGPGCGWSQYSANVAGNRIQ